MLLFHISSYIFSKAAFRETDFDISYVTPAFNLKSLLKSCSGLREL